MAPTCPRKARKRFTAASSVPSYLEGWPGPDDTVPDPQFSKIVGGKTLPLQASFGPGIGFQFRTPEEEFRLQVHYESQLEARIWGPEP